LLFSSEFEVEDSALPRDSLGSPLFFSIRGGGMSLFTHIVVQLDEAYLCAVGCLWISRFYESSCSGFTLSFETHCELMGRDPNETSIVFFRRNVTGFGSTPQFFRDSGTKEAPR